jgi:hypothetical protein
MACVQVPGRMLWSRSRKHRVTQIEPQYIWMAFYSGQDGPPVVDNLRKNEEVEQRILCRLPKLCLAEQVISPCRTC